MKSFFNTKDIKTPKNGLVVYTNSYWICDNGDTAKALFFGNSPQCNQNSKIVEHSIKLDLYQQFSKDLKVVFVETAFVPERN